MQISDLHLGRQLTRLPEDVAGELAKATREAVVEAFNVVREGSLKLVLMPGDLFEDGGHDPKAQLRFIYEQAAGVAPVPVVITPGNHDAYSAQSPYATEDAPPNVVLFTGPDFAVRETPAGPVVGRAFQAGETGSAIDWTSLPLPPPGQGIMAVHASVLHAEDQRRHLFSVAPTTEKTLKECGYTYVALGHYHNYREFQRQHGGRSFAAYSGCPQGLGWDEPGPKGFLTGVIAEDGASVEFHPAARHVWLKERLDLPPVYAGDAGERLAASLRELRENIRSTDLFSLAVNGPWPEADRESLAVHIHELLESAWHARNVDWSGVEFIPELVQPGESDVLELFLRRIDEKSGDGDIDPDVLRLARYLGHRLLSGHGLPEEVA